MNIKRMIISLILGTVFGVICALGSASQPDLNLALPILIAIGFNRVVIGLVVGLAEHIKIPVLLRGAIFGAIISLEVGISTLGEGIAGFLIMVIAGIIYGSIIDMVATKFSTKKEV